MRLAFCSCRMCKYGRNRFGNDKMITKLKRKARRLVKRLLKQGKWDDIPERISVPYTD